MDYKIIYSLRKSAVRREVLKYLATIHPLGSYPAEIARATKLSQTQVIGALRGVGGYKYENSLIALDLVTLEFVGGGRIRDAYTK